MAKLIIWLTGRPLVYGFKRRDFIWSEAHKCYLFKGKELDEQEFNEVVEYALTSHPELHPKVKIVEFSKTVAVETPPPPPFIPPPAPRLEITVEEAEAVMEQLAPDRLKKKAGRKPAPLLEVT